MPVNDEKKVGLQFIRDFYRGTSAYADHVDEELLSYIHLTTKLDEAIIKAAKDGKDIVLTGNLTGFEICHRIFENLGKIFGVNFYIPEYSRFATVIGAALQA